MQHIETIRERLPEAARDIRLNLQSVFEGSTMSAEQLWGVAVATAIASRNPDLRAAVLADAATVVDAAVIDDARAAAALMGMNNVYYRFRHMVGRETYTTRHARLRMNRIARPATNKLDFELFCLAVSAVNACESCIVSHEKTVIAGGMTEDQVVDAIRVAATMHAAAVALEMD